jgi:hypothetical protein
MSSSVALFDALSSAPDNRASARVVAEAFERLQERYPHPPDLATQGHVRESELRLQKEIAACCPKTARSHARTLLVTPGMAACGAERHGHA